jgi:hypothetical protein
MAVAGSAGRAFRARQLQNHGIGGSCYALGRGQTQQRMGGDGAREEGLARGAQHPGGHRVWFRVQDFDNMEGLARGAQDGAWWPERRSGCAGRHRGTPQHSACSTLGGGQGAGAPAQSRVRETDTHRSRAATHRPGYGVCVPSCLCILMLLGSARGTNDGMLRAAPKRPHTCTSARLHSRSPSTYVHGTPD